MSDIIPEPYCILARTLRAYMERMGFHVEYGGQLRDDRTGILWSPTDEVGWLSGGAGDLAPNLTDHRTIAALVGMLVERGWSVSLWTKDDLTVSISDPRLYLDDGPVADVVVSAFGHMTAKGHREPAP